MIKYMHERGHVIGLHFALNGLTDMELVRKKILQEIHVLSEMIGVEITEFSIHRPSADVLRENIKFPGIINAYQDEFFTFSENVTESTPLHVKYIPMRSTGGITARRMLQRFWKTTEFRF